ncbi:MAG: LysM peptidoglycan-binding domain-containing protein [Treponematales bacterium]
MPSTIGIKIASGEFYPVVEENSPVRKRLVLTTVRDDQRSVHIDLYQSESGGMDGAFRIGGLVVENISARPRGEPSIELTIAAGPGGKIIADAVDLDSPGGRGRQCLSVSLARSAGGEADFGAPDFALEEYGLYEKAKKARAQKNKKKPSAAPAVILALIALTALGLALWFFVFRSRSAAVIEEETVEIIVPAEPQPEPEVVVPEPAPPEPVPEPPPPPEAPPVITAPPEPPAAPSAERRSRPRPPVASYKVPSVIPKDGAAYRVRWGDTLWDIADAFYRNPWLYPRIARFNNIRNPDLIISGRTIRVPPRR